MMQYCKMLADEGLKIDTKIQVMQQIHQSLSLYTSVSLYEFETLIDTLIYHILAASKQSQQD